MTWDLEKEFKQMRKEMDQMWSNFFMPFNRPLLLGENKELEKMDKSLRCCTSDLYEKGNQVVAKFELPGMNKEDIKLDIKDNNLILKAEKKQESEEENKKKKYYKKESSYSGFYRSIPIPESADPNKVKAEYNNGILKVAIEKKPDHKKIEHKTIQIE